MQDTKRQRDLAILVSSFISDYLHNHGVYTAEEAQLLFDRLVDGLQYEPVETLITLVPRGGSND